ncbi:MAG: cobalamin biosynthesis protein [Rhizobiales bacterium]|nr:cobalamin biosynthesis protein [Hyphomicrobiales bacterium]
MSVFPDTLGILVLALVIDAIVGDPDRVWRRWTHPVALVGGLIGLCDRWLNRERDPPETRRMAGAASLAIVVFLAVMAAGFVESVLQFLPALLHGILLALVASVFIAQKSLYRHVAAVGRGFRESGLAGARRAVSRIVGRDPESLDDSGVSRAAIESCAENFSDGVVAPAFWFALLGLPGLVAYKAINTADSMIGHRSARYEDFGWAAARLDDLVNLAPARLSGALIALAGVAARGNPARAWRVMMSDAPAHRSPNAGWPESAMAASLGIALAGPRAYPGYSVDDPWLNAGGRAAAPADIGRALRVFVAACLLHALLYVLLTLVFL